MAEAKHSDLPIVHQGQTMETAIHLFLAWSILTREEELLIIRQVKEQVA